MTVEFIRLVLLSCLSGFMAYFLLQFFSLHDRGGMSVWGVGNIPHVPFEETSCS